MPDGQTGEEEQRRCTRCHQVKPLSAFAALRKSDGTLALRPYCRACGSAQSAAYRALHPEQKEKFNAWRRELRWCARHEAEGVGRKATEESSQEHAEEEGPGGE